MPFLMLYYSVMLEIIETTLEQEVRIFVNYISDDQKKADKVIMRYGWLAEYMAVKFSRLGINVDELYDAGIDALLEAAADYRLDCGKRFALFALEYVRNGVYQLYSDEYAIKRIDFLSDAALRARNTAGIIKNNIKQDSTDWQVSNALGIDESELMDIIYGNPIITKQNVQNASRHTANTIKNTSESVTLSLLKKTFKRFDEIIEKYEEEEDRE